MNTDTQEKGFVPDERYSELLLANTAFHAKVRVGKASYNSNDWKYMQEELTIIEREMSAELIIKHAEYLFPKVGPV